MDIEDIIDAHNNLYDEHKKLLDLYIPAIVDAITDKYNNEIITLNGHVKELKKENEQLKDIILGISERLQLLENVHSDNLKKRRDANKNYYQKLKSAYELTKIKNT